MLSLIHICAGGNRERRYAALERRNALFKDVLRGVCEPAIDVARVAKGKAIRRVLRVVEYLSLIHIYPPQPRPQSENFITAAFPKVRRFRKTADFKILVYFRWKTNILTTVSYTHLTWALLRALPALATGGDALYTIPGMPPTLIDPPKGDAFACRNEYALAIDYEKEPPLLRVTDTHYAATWLLDPRAPRICLLYTSRCV